MAKTHFTLTLATLFAAAFTAAQTNQPRQPLSAPVCPTISVSCPVCMSILEKRLTYTADIVGGDPAVTPTFNWAVSAGTITSGQGTRSIIVNPTGGGESGMTATVDVGGYDRACATSASYSFHICFISPRKVDEYGDMPFRDEKARLENFNVEMQNDPTSQGYFLCYGGRRGGVNEAQRRCDRARNFLVNSRGIDARRLVNVDAGYREQVTVELWIVPSGAAPPQATPTVAPSEVRPTRPPRKPRGLARR